MNGLRGMRFLAVLAVVGLVGAAPAASAAPAKAETLVITGATIHTLGPAGTIQNGSLVIEDGRIRAVGATVNTPAGARLIDARGKVVTPGLFDSLSRLGLVEISAVEGSQDSSVEGDRITAAFNVADALNPRSTLIPVNRTAGLTRAVVAPSTGDFLITGQGAVIHLGGAEGYLVRSPIAMFAVLGEAGAGLSGGGSRGGAMMRLREALQDTLDYAENKAAWEKGDRRSYALSRLDLEAMIPVVKGQLPLVVTVNRASDIEAVLRLAKEYRLRLILSSATEGWKVADQIAAAKVPVIVNVLDNLPTAFEDLGATLENAGRLHKAGVKVVLGSMTAHTAYSIRQETGNAVSYGLPWEEGLAAITRNPAQVWGLADKLGTLEPGKEADVVIWDGDPLEVTSSAEKVFIAGVEMPMESRQLKLRDRYRDLGGAVPPAYKHKP